MDASFLVLSTVAAVWIAAAMLRPAWYLVLLFAATPWVGLYIQYGYQLDAHKIGLLVLPAVLLSTAPSHKIPSRTGFPWPLAALLAYACALTLWQLWTSEVLAFEPIESLSLDERMAASLGLFILRLLSFAAVCRICTTERLRSRCASAYTISVFVLAVYGIVQQVTYYVFGTPLTYIMRDGVFGISREMGGTIDIAGATWLRIYSFAREPKDLAMFAIPAIPLLLARLSAVGRRGKTRFLTLQLYVILLAGVMTFSSSFLMVLPLAIIATEAMRRYHRIPSPFSARFKWVAAVVVLFPLLQIATEERVLRRFSSPEDLLQTSRERPALVFMAENTPRWFAGFGIGGQAFYLPQYMPQVYASVLRDVRGAAGMDSFALSVLLDFGLVGAFLLLALLWPLLFRQRGQPRELFPYRAALAATLLAGIPLQVDLRNGIVWLFAGLVYAAMRPQPESQPAFDAPRITLARLAFGLNPPEKSSACDTRVNGR